MASRMDKSSRIILDLCGGTGSWSLPYRERGYDVRVITWPENDVRGYEPPRGVYGILAAPPCKMFSLARTTAQSPRDLDGAFSIVIECLRIIWTCRMRGGLKFWAMENPVGILRQFLGKPPLTFNPMDYGDPYTKKTDLWGYYKFPKKSPTILTEDQRRRMSRNSRKLPDLPEGYHPPPGERRRAARRAMTPPGFAWAFYRANR